jgi:cell wall assembly regulator SMI1
MTNIELFIRNIESFGHSLSDLDFSEGASDEQLNEVEKLIKRALPDDFKLFLKNINGQHSDKLYFLPDQALLFSCEEIITEYNGQTEYFEDTIEFYNDYQCKDKIRCTVWSESRVPIGGRDGYYLFLDFDPGPNGTIGQVIFLINECDFVLLAPSFKDFLNKYNELMENKTFQIREIIKEKDLNYRLTNHLDYLNGQEFAKLFGQ